MPPAARTTTCLHIYALAADPRTLAHGPVRAQRADNVSQNWTFCARRIIHRHGALHGTGGAASAVPSVISRVRDRLKDGRCRYVVLPGRGGGAR